LSVEQLKRKTPAFGADADVLVLNSLSFLKRCHGIIKERESFLFLDNDQAGRTAKRDLHRGHVSYIDCSGFYSSFKDVNEYLINQKQQREEQPPFRRSHHI
jgi:hypothetical protein